MTCREILPTTTPTTPSTAASRPTPECRALLIIDNFALKPLRPPHDEDFHGLVAERYERTATIVASNFDFAEWGNAFPKRLLGAATLDRLRHGAYRLILEGDSCRKPKPVPKRKNTTLEK